MMIIRILLLPFAALFKFVTSVRNKLFDLGLKPSVEFDIPVIGIGNLSVGGTGKTPMVEHLIRLCLSKGITPATLSRGYGRKTKGMRVASGVDDAHTLGDEPFQFYRKFSEGVRVVVGEDRAYAIPNIVDQFDDVGVILLDDAYQHRYVRPLYNILLTEYGRPFYSDYLLPAGRLRESRTGASRADVVVVTKCPSEISGETMIEIEKKVRRYADRRVFFTTIRYGAPLPLNFSGSAEVCGRVVLVSGLANHVPFDEYARRTFDVATHMIFNDHHRYAFSDIENIVRTVHTLKDCIVLTTEKDMVKMIGKEFSELTKQITIFYLPIEIEFLKNGQEFDEMALNLFAVTK